jgi:hypothetical protein
MGDHVYLKMRAKRSSLKLGNYSKLENQYCGSFEILERIGIVAYMFSLPASMTIHNVSNVSFIKKYIPDANHVIDWNMSQVEKEGAFQVHSVCILDQKIKELRN